MLGQYWLNNFLSPGPVSKVHGSSAIRAACFSIVLLHKHVYLKAGPHSLVFPRMCVRSGRFRVRSALVSHDSRKKPVVPARKPQDCRDVSVWIFLDQSPRARIKVV